MHDSLLSQPDLMKKSVENMDVEYHTVPSRWQKVREDFISLIQSKKLQEFLGLNHDAEKVRAYHGSSIAKIPLIVENGGMKAFFEEQSQEPSIFVTASATNALWHATENGPHDTLRKVGTLTETHNPEDGILLLIEVPAKWLKENIEATEEKPSKIHEWLRAEGDPETYTRLGIFLEGMRSDLNLLQKGKEADSFGVRFPVSFIPNEYIYVITPESKQVPIIEFAKVLYST